MEGRRFPSFCHGTDFPPVATQGFLFLMQIIQKLNASRFRGLFTSAIFAGCALTGATQSFAEDNSAFMRNIEETGFSGRLANFGFGVGDVKFQPDGNFTGVMYWRNGRGYTSIKGLLKDWTLTIDEIAPIKKNRKPFVSPCHMDVEIEPGERRGKGTLSGCPVSEEYPTVKLSFKLPSPRDSVADAAVEAARKRKEAETKAEEAARPRHEAVFAVGAAQFVQDHCPALRVDFQQLTEVLRARGVTHQEAEASNEFKENMRNWNEDLMKKGEADTCYQFQASFMMLNMSRDMTRMIARRE